VMSFFIMSILHVEKRFQIDGYLRPKPALEID